MKVRSKRSNKVLAAVLAVLMVLSSVPIVAFTAFAATKYEFKVINSKSAAVSGATVEVVSVSAEAQQGDLVINEKQAVTDKNGKVSFSELDDFIENEPTATVSITLKVKAERYDEATKSFTVTSDKTEYEIPLKSNVVTVSVEGRSGKVINLYKDSVAEENKIASGAEVPTGTIVIAVPQERADDAKFNLPTVTPSYDSADNGQYRFTITGDTNIKFTYTSVTYSIAVNVDNGTFSPDTNGSIEIRKAVSNTYITFIPNSGYHFKEAKYDEADLKTVSAGDPQVENGKYIYQILNDKIDGEGHTITATFEINEFDITTNIDNTKGKIEIKNKANENGKYAYGTEITVVITPEDDYYLSKLTVNGTEVTANPVNDTNTIEYKFTVKQDTDITAELEASVKVTDTLSKYVNVKNAYYDQTKDIYYKNSDNDVKVSLKEGTTVNIDGETVTLPKELTSYKLDNNSKFKFNAFANLNNNCNITDLRFWDWQNLKVYTITDTVNPVRIRVDGKDPEITNVPTSDDFTNESVKISFNVTDPEEEYKGVKYASGIDKVTVSNGTFNQTATLNSDGKYEVTIPAVDNVSADIKYTITATDNVGNTSTETITIKNDKVAPALAEGQAIEFKHENDNAFARVINAVSFGKWLEKKLTVTVKATDGDYGAGFDGENSVATIIFTPDGSAESKSYEAKIGADGTAEATIDAPEDVFKGTVNVVLSDRLGNTSGEFLAAKDNSNIGDNDSGVLLIEENVPEVTSIEIADETYTNFNNIFNGTPKVKLTFEDKDSGLYNVEIKVNDETITYYAPTKTDEEDVTANKNTVTEYSEVETILKEAKTSKTCIVTIDLTEFTAKDGAFVITAKCTDNAGNVSEESTETYYVDMTAPKISGFEFSLANEIEAEKNDKGLYDAVEYVADPANDANEAHYSFFFKEAVKVTVNAEDVAGENQIASGIKEIHYKAIDVENAENNLEGVAEFNSKETQAKYSFDIPAGFKGQIYAYAVDNVGNSGLEMGTEGTDKGWASPDSSVLETPEMHEKTSTIEIVANTKTDKTETYSFESDRFTTEGNKVPLYKEDVDFTVTVSDTHSGIKSVEYTLLYGKNETKDLGSVSVDNDPKDLAIADGSFTKEEKSNLVTSITKNIKVNDNFNDMVLLVKLTDRVGNTSQDYYVFGIDTTAPKITVGYEDGGAQHGKYFKTDRVATVTIEERNFVVEDVEWFIKNLEGAAPVASGETLVNATDANGDNTKHIFKITYNYDGAFTFDMKYTDRAGNPNSAINYKGEAPTDFVVDKTNPTISVSYNNNSAANGKYFPAARTATITIVEHNFDVNLVNITVSASISGGAVAAPSPSWSHNGDVHTAVINYVNDGDYKFDITMLDLAGNAQAGVNYGGSVAANDFTIDKTINKPVIEAPQNGAAYGYDKDVIPQISISEINFANGSATLVRRYKDKVETVYDGKAVGNGTTTLDAIEKLPENDGIYTLTVSYTDMAGNKSTESITFTVNRFGSVFVFSDDLIEVIKDEYVQEVRGDIYVTEYNSTQLKENSQKVEILRDNSQVDNDIASVPVANPNVTTGESGWYEYVYKLDNKYFATDGVYAVTVHSVDAVENENENISYDTAEQTEDAQTVERENSSGDISFKKDGTPPDIVSVIGMEKASVRAAEKVVDYVVHDAIGLKSIEVYINDKLDADATVNEFADVSNYSGSFKIGAMNQTQKIRLVITDLAGNVINTAETEFDPKTDGYIFRDEMTVTPNIFALWYANKPLFWGSIGGTAAVAALVIFLVAKKRKKNDDEAQTA